MSLIKTPTECPECGHTWWQKGPSGGLSTNYRCRKCGLIINVIGAMAEIVGKNIENLPDISSD